MLGSYGLLGIFVYCEHKAGLTPPTNTHTQIYFGSPCFSLWIVLKSVVTYIQTDLEARRSGWRRWLKRRWCGSLMERHSSLQGASINIIPITSNKTGMKSLPRSFCRFWFKHYCIFSFFWWFWWISMLLLYFICSLWGCPSFSCKRSPPFLYLFYPTNIFM